MKHGAVAITFAGLMVAVVTIHTWIEAIVAMVAVMSVAWLTLRTKVHAMVVRLRPFVYFAVIAIIFGGLGGENPVFSLGPLHWGSGPLGRAGIAAIRLVALGAAVGWVTLFVGTSTLLGHMWRSSDRLKRQGIDLSALLVGLAVAIRFLPLLQDEAVRLRRAWEARGAGLLGWSPAGRIRYVTGLIVPILAAALRRAEAFAVAVELRAGRHLGAEQPSGGALYAALAPPSGEVVPGVSPDSMEPVVGQGTLIAMAWTPVALKILGMLG